MSLTKKPVAEIKAEQAKTTIAKQHQQFGKMIGVNGCFGSSNTGQITGFIAREIVKNIPNAFMRCPLALYPEVEGATQVLLYDDYQVVIDGCKERCLKKTLENSGIKVDLSYALDEDFQLVKQPGPDFDEAQIKKISENIIKDIKDRLI